MSRLSDKPEVKDRLKEIRRKGKNRNAAKKSRRSMLERMGRLRSTVAHLSDVLNYKKALMKKIQVKIRFYSFDK